MIRRFLTSVGIGAGLMYLFDPQLGRRRRTALRDTVVRCQNGITDAVESVARDLRHCVRGNVPETPSTSSAGENVQGPNVPEPWAPATRVLVGVAGASLVLRGLLRRSLISTLLGGLTLGVLADRSCQAGARSGQTSRGPTGSRGADESPERATEGLAAGSPGAGEAAG